MTTETVNFELEALGVTSDPRVIAGMRALYDRYPCFNAEDPEEMEKLRDDVIAIMHAVGDTFTVTRDEIERALCYMLPALAVAAREGGDGTVSVPVLLYEQVARWQALIAMRISPPRGEEPCSTEPQDKSASSTSAPATPS